MEQGLFPDPSPLAQRHKHRLATDQRPLCNNAGTRGYGNCWESVSRPVQNRVRNAQAEISQSRPGTTPPTEVAGLATEIPHESATPFVRGLARRGGVHGTAGW